MNSKNHVELQEKDIQKNVKIFHDMLNGFTHSAQDHSTRGETRRRAYVPGMASSSINERSTQINVIKTINDVTPEYPIDSNRQHRVITSLLRGLCIADAITDIYAKQSGLSQLKEQNSRNSLIDTDKSKFIELLSASSLIAAQVLSNFILHQLSDNDAAVDISPPDNISCRLGKPISTCEDILAKYCEYISQQARDDDQLIKYTKLFFDTLLEELAIQQSGISILNPAIGNEYFSSKDDFAAVIGERTNVVATTSFVMEFKKPEQVIGNAIAKYQSLKLAKMMMCYDFDRQLNPFADLGGYIFTFMGDGNPGTGKTTLIQMLAGLLKDYTDNAGIPFYYENLSIDNLDSYQGKSAQNTKSFINNILNPHSINFGTIDDIDQICAKRGDKNASAGQSEITAVLMESFAGANTIVRGNASFGMFSNYPELVDDALRQRAGARFLIDGPVTHEDFVDILALLLGDTHEIKTGNIDLFVTQEIKSIVSSSYESHNLPKEERLLEVHSAVIAKYGHLETLENIGHYLKAIQVADDRFTGRAIKNIVDATKVRSMDFDLPDEYFENPDVFLNKEYEEKKNILLDHRISITPAMLLQEVNRYADSEFRYAANSDEAAISGLIRNRRISEKANKRFNSQSSTD